jgi:hypothetical protein
MRPGTLLDRLLRGRAWVALTAVLLVGIVFLNVNLLEINGSIARMDTHAAELKRENAALRMRIAQLGSSERIQAAAARLGFVPVEPGSVGYLTATRANAARAARALEGWRPPPIPGEGAAPSLAASRGGAPATSAGASASPSAGSTETSGGGQRSPGQGAGAATP